MDVKKRNKIIIVLSAIIGMSIAALQVYEETGQFNKVNIITFLVIGIFITFYIVYIYRKHNK